MLMIRTAVSSAVLLAAFAAQASVVFVPSSTLDQVTGSTASVYTGLDAAGTSMTASTVGGNLASIVGGGFEGLWFGGDQSSGTYTFSFSAPVNFFEIHINAMSTFASYVETIGSWAIDTAAPMTLSFTNIQNTAWDGATVTSGPNDNGEFVMDVSVAPGQSFNSVSFFHFQLNSPNGSVVRDISYELAPVPEPASWALMLAGLGLAGLAARRRR